RLVHQILLNLLGNAVKYAVPGTIALGVDWRERPRLYVEDQGPGLTDAELQRVFQPFVQLQPQGSTGVGLGLAISTRLAHALGGALHAARADGGGTRFWLELPPTARG
ncbi:MAG: ATP-binding protein, partial [Myxococcota bacterium]